ncbi:MAG: ATPase [Dysgonomonas sp.]|nr:ATPase [Dysgonomonas sp.]
MIIIADGGSTKVDWRLIEEGKEIRQVYTKGMNPFFRSSEEISEEIKSVLMPEVGTYSIEAVYFFGAGCTPQKSPIVYNAIVDNIENSVIMVDSDLLAAAKGLCGHNKGVACILGTGSNSCHYDGADIVDHVSPLGYILGDEGSGAVIGRLFLNVCLKNILPSSIKKDLFDKYDLSVADILDKVYKQPMANRFLASLSPFIIQYIGHEVVYNIIYNSIKDFFIKNIFQYNYDYKENPVHFTGSIAYYYQEVLKKVATDLNVKIGTIVQSPMEGLIKYYNSELV